MHDCTVRRVHIYATILIAGVSLLAGGCGEKTADESAPTAAAAEEPAASAAKVAEAKPAAADEGVMKLTVAKADPAKVAAKKAAKAKAEAEAAAAARAALTPLPDEFHGSWLRRDASCTKGDCEGSKPRDALVVITKYKIFYESCDCSSVRMNVAQLSKGETKDGSYTFTYGDGAEGSLEKLPNGVLLTLDGDEIAGTLKRPKGYKHRKLKPATDTKSWLGEWIYQSAECSDSECERHITRTLNGAMSSTRFIYDACDCNNVNTFSLPIISGTFVEGVYDFNYGDVDFPKMASLQEVSDGLAFHVSDGDVAGILRRPKGRKAKRVEPVEDTTSWRGEWFFRDVECTSDSDCERPKPRVQSMTLTGSRLVYKRCDCNDTNDWNVKLKDGSMKDGVYTFKTDDDKDGVMEMTPDGLVVDIGGQISILAKRKKSDVKLQPVMDLEMASSDDEDDDEGGSESCDEYVECVCDLGEALADETGSDPYKGMCKAAKKLLTKAQGKACSMALNAFKRGLKAAKSGYEMMGIDIPSSCE